MKVLGIETSCDETSAAVVSNAQDVLSNVVASSLKDHAVYGGIIPEIASRRQMELIYPVVSQALERAKCSLNNIDLIAVTTTPGLIGSLLVGICFAKGLSQSRNIPLIEVNHIHAHAYAPFCRMSNVPDWQKPSLPAIALVVSGGHTSLFKIKDFNNIDQIGKTRDDAAGEAYDKVARILGLGYPGGPVIDKIAPSGKNNRIHFSKANIAGTLDFSFSGIKTAVLYHAQSNSKNSSFKEAEVAYSFQESVVEVLVEKSISACKQHKITTLLMGGGVAANSRLRERLAEESLKSGIKLYIPPLGLCLDNAAMIAGLGGWLFKRGV